MSCFTFLILTVVAYQSGWVSLALMQFVGPIRYFQNAIASSRARVKAKIGPEHMKAVKLGKFAVPYSSA